MSPLLPSYKEASAIVAAHAVRFATQPRPTETIPLHEAANRILAANIHADREMPPFPRSTRDGYAIRADELNTGSLLRITGCIRAGSTPSSTPLLPNTAVEIMTGAAVPPSADTVVMVEHVETASGYIRLLPPRTLSEGENINPIGSEAHTGDLIIPTGTRLSASHIAAAASCGFAQVEVFRKPTVAILTTGDELVPVTATPNPGQIRNSNASMLGALVEQFGGQPQLFPATADTPKALDAVLQQVTEADLVLLSGGVSAGKFDLVEPAIARLDAEFYFTGARIQPGKPVVFGSIPRNTHQQPFFGLPGNPISSAATFLLFAAPILATLAGRTVQLPRFTYARLTREVKAKPDLTRFVPSTVTADAQVTPEGAKGSGDLASFARSNCFLVVPEGEANLPANEIATILPF